MVSVIKAFDAYLIGKIISVSMKKAKGGVTEEENKGPPTAEHIKHVINGLKNKCPVEDGLEAEIRKHG